MTEVREWSRPAEPDSLPAAELDVLQVGHLRHIIRLSRQKPGDWSDMGPFDPTNEGDDAYRYQLAYMAYTLGLVQYHYLPAYRELIRETLAALITKMLRHDVWGYWELTSRGSKVMDPDLDSLVEGWVDPVASKNVMYSGHLLMMASLYEMLYRDGRFLAPGSLTFQCRPPFRGLGPEDFPYDLSSLAQVIEEQFAESGGMGCECEPNGVFVYCNQFPLLGLQHLDHCLGTERSGPMMGAFKDAWAQRSSLFAPGDSPELPVFLMVRQQEVVTEGSEDNKEAASAVSWGPFLHVWQPDYVERLYPGVLRDVRMQTEWGYGVSLERFHRTHLEYQAQPSIELVDPMMLGVHTHGMLALLAAELGDDETREGLLAHADAVMNPRWREGGLFYPRCDDLSTERYVTCVTGNALLGAARINVRNGIHDLYNHPWTDAELAGPQVVDVDYPAVLVTHARYDRNTRRMTLALRPGDGPPTDAFASADRVAEFAVEGLQPPCEGAGSAVAAGLTVRVNGVELASGSMPASRGAAAMGWDEATRRLTLRVPLPGPVTVTIDVAAAG